VQAVPLHFYILTHRVATFLGLREGREKGPGFHRLHMCLIIRNQNIRGRVQTTYTWSHDLTCDILFLFITSSTISKTLQDYGEATTTTPVPATHFSNILLKTNRSIWKQRYSPNPVDRLSHTNFAIADCYSNLSITSGVLNPWRAFGRARSSPLITYTTMIHV